MRLLLDTMVLIWSITKTDRISTAVLDLLRDGSTELAISSISLSEIAIKHSAGKLNLNRAETEAGITDLRLAILPFNWEHSLRMFDLPLHHKDPFDRQIIAQALAERIPVVTVEPYFRLYEGLEVIW